VKQLPLVLQPPDRQIPIPIPASTDVSSALNFACPRRELQKNRGKYGVIYRIQTKHGYQFPRPHEQQEMEVLLPPDISYKITDVQLLDLKAGHNSLLQDCPRVWLADICSVILVDLSEQPAK
jgi:hypothetical protein